jgi:hypothetical protein
MLQQLQQAFLANLSTDDPEFVKYVGAIASLSPSETLEIYRQHIQAKALRPLGGIYSACQKILGQERFEAICNEFFQTYPPQDFLFDGYIAPFAEFLAEHPCLNDYPYIADVAELEWQIDRLLKAVNSPQLDLEALKQVESDRQGDIVFNLPAGAVLMQSDYPLDEIYSIVESDDTENTLTDWQLGHYWFIVWRANADFGIFIESLTKEEWLVLQRIATGASFKEVCDNLSQFYPTLDIASIFPRLVEQGWIASFRVN